MMSISAMEKALWQIYQNPADTERFGADAQAYVEDFNLDELERSMLVSFDSMAMISHGANPLLVMMAFQTAMGMERFPEYFATVNGMAGDAPTA
jgi:aromatic-ring opening dioxygenase LigAB LigA subunit